MFLITFSEVRLGLEFKATLDFEEGVAMVSIGDLFRAEFSVRGLKVVATSDAPAAQ